MIRASKTALFAGLICTVLSRAACAESLETTLRDYGLDLESAPTELKVLKDRDRKGEKLRLRTLEAESPGLFVEMRAAGPLSAEQAGRFSATEYLTIEGLYRQRETPYAGQISKSVTCPESLALRKAKTSVLNKEVTVLTGAANDRKVFGACDSALFRYSAAFVAFYLPESSVLLEFRIFSPARPGLGAPDSAPALAFLKRIRRASK